MTNPICVNLQGSPPRRRGKVGAQDFLGLHGGITPAWAGKSGSGSCYCLGSGDHPRMGGEKWNLRQRSKMLLGSPPHGRGKAFWSFCTCAAARITPAWAGKSCHFWDCQKGVRITPAWAGKSGKSAVKAVQFEDHPRMGGEKDFLLPFSSLPQTSPPHGRGKAAVPLSW